MVCRKWRSHFPRISRAARSAVSDQRRSHGQPRPGKRPSKTNNLVYINVQQHVQYHPTDAGRHYDLRLPVVPAPASGGGDTRPSCVRTDGRHWKRSRSAMLTVLSVSMAVAARSTLHVSCNDHRSVLATYRGTTASPRRSLAIMASFHLRVSMRLERRRRGVATHRSTQRHQRHPSVSPGKPGRREERSLPVWCVRDPYSARKYPERGAHRARRGARKTRRGGCGPVVVFWGTPE